LSDLVTESGFDKRTIAYYTAEGLLPKVGRRGPKSSYPRTFLERLLFIRRVRTLQDAGQLRAVTLTEIRDVMNRLTPEELRGAAESTEPVAWIRERFQVPDLDTSRYAVPAEMVASLDPRQSELVAEDELSLISPAGPAASHDRLPSLGKRRNKLRERVSDQELQVGLEAKVEHLRMQTQEARAAREEQLHRLENTIHRFESRVDQMYRLQTEMQETLQRDISEMKQLVSRLDKRLAAMENGIKPDSETDQNEPDSNEG
jgi:DNA-binding transcriptional MerR regulator